MLCAPGHVGCAALALRLLVLPAASMREATPSELAGKLPSEIADPAAEAPWRYNMKSTLTVDCSKATKDLGIEFRSPATSVRDLCADSVFQSLVKPVTA